jgi:adenine-specific DNA-methyltransferase
MDEVFGSDNFISLITVKKTGGLGTDLLKNVTDYILWYAADKGVIKYRQVLAEKRQGVGHSTGARYDQVMLGSGEVRPLTPEEKRSPDAIPSDARTFQLDNLVSSGTTPSCVFTYIFNGTPYSPGGQRSWKTNRIGMDNLAVAGRVSPAATTLRYVRFLDDFAAYELNNVWDDVALGTDKIYVVQSPTSIIERCVLMTTDPGDLVLDPTCGSGTTAYVAEQWGRRWITIDTSRVALTLARQRLMGARFPYYLLADSAEGRAKEGQISATPLPPAKVTDDIRHGFVYERVQHITLRSIATNPDIKEGMSRAEIDQAIRRHAEFELLYDKPCEDSKKVRVSGPFTVESLSPHRSLAFSGSAVDGTGSVNTNELAEASHGDAWFEQTILANLRTAGIQNGRKGERLTFDTLEPYAASYIQAVGERDEAADGTPRRVGVTIGPQYGTVGPSFIKDAAREANKAGGLDLLCVLAFAFDPAVLGTGDDYVTSEDSFANVAAERQLGRIPVLLVRMNADLVMGEELKKTGAGNLFTVFGEPDIEVKRDGDDELRVVLHGVDVYDPNTGELRSNDTNQIALWMIDTAYNEESFFVRHCYFTGGQDPYARLKRALQADIDQDAWESLRRTESRPFPLPDSGKIAVKVINDYGDEVMKVFAV